ncbi:carboxyl-terminal processing protease [Dyadobacter jejuensis]|uniref:Carboxyl-terminal processing protease n=1 Tax=Dyadobacter jejuensis TaxID=1082580 RepID=A0A316AC16_9BACT|nr:S41 family peptidase [Dyadobacter jejuensis]PWJ55265.1 carboxyl-terminal processing protease [Dyadobacter jejuensis]
MRKYLRTAWLALPLLAGLALVSFRQDDRLFEIAKNLDIYATLFKELNAYYVDEINPNKLIKSSIDNMLKTLDPYTVYYAEDDIEDYMTMTTGKYNGIGAMVSSAEGKHQVMMVYEGTPAQKAGLQLGDEIIKINDVDIENREDFDTGKLLRGQTQTSVKLTIRRFGNPTPIVINLSRDVVKVTNVPYYGMIADGVGYIDLKDFTATASREVRNAFQELKGQGMKSLVLDLRDNPGGLLNMAIEISNIFVAKGEEIVSTKGKVSEWNKTYTAYNPALDTEIPMVVLTNNRSASAAEIVAGVMQDYDRGVLIGQRTYGKGLVQTTRDLSFNTKMKITTAKYYIPSGRCIQAIDYSHRNEDGSVGKLPDSLMTSFKTRNGRVVYDGGGILPDILTERETYSPLAIALGRNRLFFDYAVEYHSKHATIATAAKFHLSDAEYDAFVKWLSDKEYDYTSQVERDLASLEESAKKEKSYESIQGQLAALQSKLTHNKDNDLQLFKAEIKNILEEEIIKHYYLEKGMREASFEEDEEVKQALALFKTPTRYKEILQAK